MTSRSSKLDAAGKASGVSRSVGVSDLRVRLAMHRKEGEVARAVFGDSFRVFAESSAADSEAEVARRPHAFVAKLARTRRSKRKVHSCADA